MNNKYWFFGSKLNTVLLLILIILMIIALRWMYQDKEKYWYANNREAKTYEKYQDTNTDQMEGNWVSSPTEFGNVVSYPLDWQIVPQYYGSPAMMANGGKESLVGYSFTLPSGAMIVWGGPKSDCVDSEFGEFKYGVSSLTCLKSMDVSIGRASAREILSSSDLKLFGDFVLKNK